jgi:formamidopyrimidine-DNA glycosylase
MLGLHTIKGRPPCLFNAGNAFFVRIAASLARCSCLVIHIELVLKIPLEPLGDEFTAGALLKVLNSKTKASIKTALLDQRVVAGIGNIYACEALYESRIHPERVASSLKKEEAEALVKAIQNVLNKAIAAGGSTLRDHKQTDGSQGYFQHQFDVYDQAGTTCKRCRDTDEKCIARIKQAGRSTFYCVQTQH